MLRVLTLALATAFATLPLTVPLEAAAKGCPPGLAKKNPPCIPPGQAKKMYHRPHVGDRIDEYDYELIRYPDRYGLDPLRPGERYYVLGDSVVRVNQDTYEILQFIGAAAALLD